MQYKSHNTRLQSSGQFGLIRRAILYLDNEHTESAITAVKMLRTSSITEDDINDILREAHTMYKFNHLNVLSIIGVVWQRGDPPLVVLPFMGKGSLLELVRKEDTVSECFLIVAIDAFFSTSLNSLNILLQI